MELEDVDARIDLEAWRVANALGVEVWHQRYWGAEHCKYVGYAPRLYVTCWIANDGWRTFQLGITEGIAEGQLCGPISSVGLHSDGKWFLVLQKDGALNMARALYRLSFEDEGVLSQLPQLSAHEKMELRLSLLREFWPKQWLDEERQYGH